MARIYSFPEPRVREVVECSGALAELLELPEQGLVAAERQPRVEKHVRRR